MDEAKLRAWWFHRQGLDGGLAGVSPAGVLERTGWARSMGGSSPYLGFHGRGGAGREAIDAAVAALEIHELPSARGCTYVVPASDFALALALSQGFGQEADMRVARKLDDLGDMRAFSLDSPKSRQPRLEQLRAAQTH
jgi:hypothetical protein